MELGGAEGPRLQEGVVFELSAAERPCHGCRGPATLRVQEVDDPEARIGSILDGGRSEAGLQTGESAGEGSGIAVRSGLGRTATSSRAVADVESSSATASGSLALVDQLDDRQVLASPLVTHDELQFALEPADRRSRLREWKPLASLDAAVGARPGAASEDLGGGRAAQGLMRACRVVPVEVGQKLGIEGGLREGDEDPAEALVLQGEPEALDDRDGAVLADGAVAGEHSVARAPGEVFAAKLRTLIGDDVSRSLAGLRDRGVEEGADLFGGGLLLEGRGGDHRAGEVIEDGADPEAERPALEDGEGDPGRPEAEGCWDCCARLDISRREVRDGCSQEETKAW